MNLLYRITLRISLALLVLFAIWGTVFYYIIIDEINDETDDALEDFQNILSPGHWLEKSFQKKITG